MVCKPSRIAFAFVLVGLLVLPATFAADEAAYMTDDERSEMLRLLDESRDLLEGLIQDVSDEQWTWKPGPDRWSVAECAEHIVMSESRLFASVRGALSTPARTDWMEKTKGKAELLRRVMPNRNPGGAGGASAPQEIRPKGGLTKADILAEFDKIRSEVRADSVVLTQSYLPFCQFSTRTNFCTLPEGVSGNSLKRYQALGVFCGAMCSRQ